MDQILIFNFCSIPIYLIILFTTFVRKTTKGTVNKLFLWLIFISLSTCLIDLIADGYGPFLPLSKPMLIAVTIANYVYFALRNAIPLLYLFFLLEHVRMHALIKNTYSRLILSIPYFFVLVVLFTNPVHNLAFTVTSDVGYARGPLLYVFYAISIGYSLAGVILLIVNYKLLRFVRFFALISMYLLSFIGIAIQLFYSNVLIEIFATSIAFLFVILVVLRPEEITDMNVGLPSWKAYQEELYKLSRLRNPKKHPVTINVVRFVNASQVRDFMGESKFYEYMVEIANIIENHRQRNKILSEMYYEVPGTLYFILENPTKVSSKKTVDLIKMNEMYAEVSDEIRKYTQEFENSGVYLKPKMCSISYPDDIEHVEDIITLGHVFHTMMPADVGYISASDLVQTERYKIESDMNGILNNAIHSKSFEMYYQPIFNFEDGAFRSAEALIRLKHPRYGYISPSVFIPAAEKLGLILAIGDFVLETVFEFVSKHDLKSMGLKYVEINLSVGQCFQMDLVDKIRKLQEKYNVDPATINFEITETFYNDVDNSALNNIRRLVEMGYSFSLDDYGTGYSSIQRIMKLPLSITKLDKSLIDELGTPQGDAIVRNTISMMKDINKKVLAEGVEQASQLELLQEMGCDYIQGFHFSKPLPGEEFVDFLRKRHEANN